MSFYSFVSQIIPYSDPELEMLYSYGRYLVPHLDLNDTEVNPHPEKEVVLKTIKEMKNDGLLVFD